MKAATATAPVAAPNAQQARFIDNGDGTITDTKLGLMWSKATISKRCVTHDQATKICADLDLAGHKDWCLPEIEDLFLLADRSRSSPAIDTDFFPDTKNDWYWASTPYAPGSSCAWIVYFDYGDSDAVRRDGNLAFVRACRVVPAGQ